MQDLLSEMGALRAANETLRRERDEELRENRLMRDVVDAACCLYVAWIESGEYDDAAELVAEAYGVYLARRNRDALAAKEEE